MLSTINEKPIKSVPHQEAFKIAISHLGTSKTAAIRTELNAIIDNMAPEKEGSRTFSSSFLGSKLTPWPEPLSYLYDVAKVLQGKDANEKQIQDKAALLFGQFVWECIMNREESWSSYDPNISHNDPNREIMGKVYFERTD